MATGAGDHQSPDTQPAGAGSAPLASATCTFGPLYRRVAGPLSGSDLAGTTPDIGWPAGTECQRYLYLARRSWQVCCLASTYQATRSTSVPSLCVQARRSGALDQ